MILLLALLSQVDPALPEFRPEGKLEGQLVAVGSDTLNNLMTLWAEALYQAHPGLRVSVEGKGGSSPMPALIAGTSHLAPMSRPPRSTELKAFVDKYGYPPTEFRVALDALAVFVPNNNPIRSLTLEQVDAVFSKTRRRGGREVKTWGDLGLEGEWADKPIVRYGRNSASGTYGFFKEVALKNGDYTVEVLEQPGSASVVLGCMKERFAIGYAGVGYKTSSVRAVPLAAAAGDAPVEGTVETSLTGAYPLSRYLLILINRDPAKPCEPRVKEFLRLVFSKQGQEVVVKDGYFPLSEKVAAEERKKLE